MNNSNLIRYIIHYQIISIIFRVMDLVIKLFLVR